jgi:hypothetical protein
VGVALLAGAARVPATRGLVDRFRWDARAAEVTAAPAGVGAAR